MRRVFVGVLGISGLLGLALSTAPLLSRPAIAQSSSAGAQLPTWMGAVWNQAHISPLGQILRGETPATIPQTLSTPDERGILSSYQPNGATATGGNGFFTPLGSNGRSCFSCHQPQAGWAMNPETAVAQFITTGGKDPMFAPVDGANCPDTGAAAKTLLQKALASSQLLTKGNIRIFLPIPANAQYQVRVLRDPYGCENSATYGLPSGMLSVYRRVLSAANLSLNSQLNATFNGSVPQGTIMWDGREPTLQSQFVDATLGHAQASAMPSMDAIKDGVTFQDNIYSAQSFDLKAGSLTANGATGGPVALSTDPTLVPIFFLGAEGVNIFDGWAASTNPAQQSIKRGQDIFNNRKFVIQDVYGINGNANVPGPFPNPVSLTCANCHSNQNVGNDAAIAMKHLGVADNSNSILPPSADQPLFSFLCPTGSIPFFSNPVMVNGVTYDDFQTSDPGVALVSGQCQDLGVFKVPRLRALAARAPYFHGGNAADLRAVVEFYNSRFTMALSEQDKQDLINFLGTL